MTLNMSAISRPAYLLSILRHSGGGEQAKMTESDRASDIMGLLKAALL